ncbi:hypothetical protein [Flavobacterium sp.]|uniref:hypothetical protein n=1 Tax=Flavobacterium sp. TaxID=239 RepID=UPI0039E62E9F
MDTYAQPIPEKTIQPLNSKVTQKKSSPGLALVDNRPGTVAKKQIQQALHGSPQVNPWNTDHKMDDRFTKPALAQNEFPVQRKFKSETGSNSPIQLLKMDSGKEWTPIPWEDDSGMIGLVKTELLKKPKAIRKAFEQDGHYRFEAGGVKWLVDETDVKMLQSLIVDFHRPVSPWTELGQPPTSREENDKQVMVQLLKDVVDLASRMPDQLKSIMPHDKVYNMTPEGQLEYCVKMCKGELDLGILAKCLYTTYFYAPINNFLRRLLPGNVDKAIIALIEKTLAVLEKTVHDDMVTQEIQAQRVELKAEWMGDPKKGDSLNFPAFTSMHPSAKGVENMAGDIGEGTFGDLTKLAVLKFQGRTKILKPDKKYYPDEVEIVIPPGMKAVVMDVENFSMIIPKIGKVDGKKYTLKIVSPEEASGADKEKKPVVDVDKL